MTSLLTLRLPLSTDFGNAKRSTWGSQCTQVGDTVCTEKMRSGLVMVLKILRQDAAQVMLVANLNPSKMSPLRGASDRSVSIEFLLLWCEITNTPFVGMPKSASEP
jgi:hypothetical protein